jgi:hypothetical protein
MAQHARSLPANYPQPIGTQILKADAQRQASMLRQEIVTDLLGLLPDTREAHVRARMVRLIESYLKSGAAAAERAEELWPDAVEVKELLAARAELKPATARKHLSLFDQLDRTHRRSLELLQDSFGNIRLILERLRPPEPPEAHADTTAPPKK